jgi:hypothetical protein
MSGPRLRVPAGVGSVHPVVLERRIRDLLYIGLSALVPAVIALALSVELREGSLLLVVGAIAAAVGIVALMMYSRLEVSVALVVVYFGLIDGPVKLLAPGREVTASLQDVLILAISAGCLMRIVARKERVSLPALSGWVLAWTALVLMNMFNPRTEGILHVLGGLRNQLQYVPFFFFGYVLMRSKRRFRQYFIIVGVVALANAVVAGYQTGLSPGQMASWGPGYHDLIYIPSESKGAARTYASEGESRVRPPGLGSDEGFSGAVGQLAIPACLALLVIARRRKWLAAVLVLGAGVAVIVSLGRLAVIGSALGVVVFAALAALAGQRVTRTLGAMLVIFALAVPTGALVISSLRPGTFKRYERISSPSSTSYTGRESSWSRIPEYVKAEPFGFGLGNSGPVSGLGGHSTNLFEGKGLSSETQYNVLVKELGLPGLILWPLLVFYVMFVTLTGMRRVRDPDTAICLAGAMAPFFVLPIEGTAAFLETGVALGPYFWFAIGVAAYWFRGPGRARSGAQLDRYDAALAAG